VDGLEEGDAKRVVKAACTIKDVVETVSDPEDMAENALVNFGGQAMLAARVVDVAKKMAEADSSGQAQLQFAVFRLCESV
jgi:hypothetical protein